MPAVDPHRLKSQIAKLQELLDNPRAFRWRVRDLLEYYSDRTKRPGGVSDSSHSFGVLKPILRDLQRALVSMLGDDSDATLSIAKELWLDGYREMRIVAIGIMKNVSPQVSKAQFEHWSGLTQDPKIAEKLAQMSFEMWRKEPQADFFQKIKQLISDLNIESQTYALLLLRIAAGDLETDHLPLIYDILEDVNLQKHASTRALFQKLLQDLAIKRPAETAKFLLKKIEEDDVIMKRMARDLLSAFPARQKGRIKQALSA
jgi:DNA alkylation repair enzyme